MTEIITVIYQSRPENLNQYGAWKWDKTPREFMKLLQEACNKYTHNVSLSFIEKETYHQSSNHPFQDPVNLIFTVTYSQDINILGALEEYFCSTPYWDRITYIT